MKLKIDDEECEVKEVYASGYLPTITLTDGREFYVAESSETAGQAARKYWEDMAKNDKKEFACLVGEKTLVSWALGEHAGPGSAKVKDLQEWLDLHLSIPEEHFGSYDNTECDVTEPSEELVEKLSFTPTVAYRHN